MQVGMTSDTSLVIVMSRHRYWSCNYRLSQWINCTLLCYLANSITWIGGWLRYVYRFRNGSNKTWHLTVISYTINNFEGTTICHHKFAHMKLQCCKLRAFQWYTEYNMENAHIPTTTAQLQHHYNTTTAQLQHHYSTTTAPLQHHHITTTAPLQHHYSTTTAPPSL